MRLERPLGDPEFGRSVPCLACVEPEPEVAAIARSGIPPEFVGCTLASWQPPERRRGVDAWIASWPPERTYLLLSGNKGAGKTHIACGLLRAAWEHYQIRGLFRPVVDLVDEYRRASRGEPEEQDVIDAAVLRVPLLVLDDYGAERETALAAERIYRVVDVRYRERRPTIVTTNVPPAELEERVYSRIASGIVVRFAGDDRRLR